MWLATAYEEGWFGEKSFSEALKWYKKSAALRGIQTLRIL
jgi:hypothetical protein